MYINRVLCLTTVFYYILDVKAIQALTEDGNTPAVHAYAIKGMFLLSLAI